MWHIINVQIELGYITILTEQNSVPSKTRYADCERFVSHGWKALSCADIPGLAARRKKRKPKKKNVWAKVGYKCVVTKL